ncbi:hypothetical protein HK104_000883 [Borealophlyctis nickersoniae]|nr:hypothetical protein HK104_000883 [Borealophlyctis nickersoniae]
MGVNLFFVLLSLLAAFSALSTSLPTDDKKYPATAEAAAVVAPVPAGTTDKLDSTNRQTLSDPNLVTVASPHAPTYPNHDSGNGGGCWSAKHIWEGHKCMKCRCCKNYYGGGCGWDNNGGFSAGGGGGELSKRDHAVKEATGWGDDGGACWWEKHCFGNDGWGPYKRDESGVGATAVVSFAVKVESADGNGNGEAYRVCKCYPEDGWGG